MYGAGGEFKFVPKIPHPDGFNSALEIVTKLCVEEFARKAKAADFMHQTWDILRNAGAGDGDKVGCIFLYARSYSDMARRSSTSS